MNEDRFHVDTGRGIFMVIDGLGGQAAGGKAADTALAMLRTRLERETGPVDQRVREAIAIANYEIHRLASTRREWNGMACVLTVAVVENGHAVVGHVGDTRLYRMRAGSIEKVTRDHSPVGEREDAREISESEAMRHPRRNEVYRDVGSEPHEPSDSNFIDVYEVPMTPDTALLLCSDGLTDLVDADGIKRIVQRFAGHPSQVVKALVDSANDAGGKDNITAVFVEGERFSPLTKKGAPGGRRSSVGVVAGGVLIGVLLAVASARILTSELLQALSPDALIGIPANGSVIVQPNESIAKALEAAPAGTDVIVEPGEYRERLILRDGVRLISRVPRGAILRLPSSASEGESAILASGPITTEVNGFRIVGDAATPLGTGIVVRDAALTMVNIEISGAARAALDISGPGAVLIGSDIHDNPGLALAIRSQAAPQVTHNIFSRNGLSARAAAALLIEPSARPNLTGNIFEGPSPAMLATDPAVRAAILRNNWFVGNRRAETPSAPNGRGR